VANPSATPTPAPNISYDANGNRSWFGPYGSLEQYWINNLSQYTSRTIYTGNTQTSGTASYDVNGNMTATPDPPPSQLACTYDAQNRVLSASKGNTTMYFTYDGLNRQVSRRIGMNGTATYSVWDGWNLIEEYQAANNGAMTAGYVYGAGGLIAGVINGQFNYYYQDGSGSTSHVANTSGVLQEWYRYDLQGKPFFYNSNDTQLSASAFNVRHLFTGQQWYSDIGLYDLRNRFYSPDIGRFLQSDPIGFRGDRSNLYRYCGNNPVMRRDPSGLKDPIAEVERVIVSASYIPSWLFNPNYFSPGPNFLGAQAPSNIIPLSYTRLSPYYGAYGPAFGNRELGYRQAYIPFPRFPEDDQPTQQSAPPPQNPPTPTIDPSHPTTTAEFIAAGNMIEHGNTMDTTPVIDPISLASGAFAARVALTGFTQVAATRAMWVGKDGLAAAQASGASLLKPSQAALNAMRTGDMSLMQAESAAWARGATGQVPVFFGDGAGRTFLNHELPELLKNMDSGKVTEIDISF